jgi:ribosomal protein S18 acetylase RimI-like enzyme
VFVRQTVRRQGVGRALLEAALAWIAKKGRSQVVLWSKTNNRSAQRLFAKLGFRDTMVEMTLDR